jgi:hypothetical protein
VQAEKEQAARAQQSGSAQTTTAGNRQGVSMPPASLEMLLTTLATEALVALGQIPHPMAGDLHVDREQAKYLIDTIEVLRDKTKGNLTAAEQQLIDSLLHQMRLVFVETARQSAETPSGATTQ